MNLSKIAIVILSVGIAILAAFLIFLNINKEKIDSSLESKPNEAGSSLNQKQTVNDRLVIADQPAGLELKIDKATLKNAGYIVVQKAADTGSFGSIVGNSSYLGAGTHENVTVKIYKDVNLKPGDVLFASLRIDNGDKGYGASDAASLVEEESGNILQVKFTLQ